MSKRLVVCCDGTWNTPDQLSGSANTPTGVSKIALGVAQKDADANSQLLHYQVGVGTRGTQFQRIRGLIAGYGLSSNVRACYRFVARNYEPGDKLYFFGFSRGAYTARSTVGLIRNCGILRPEHLDRIDEAYGLYRSRSDLAHPRGVESRIFRRMYSHDDIEIHFVGVWDTVGSLGIPIDGLPIPAAITKHWTFHDTELSSRVSHAYQALAIDEQRGQFRPALWTQKQHVEGQVLEQVWFAGVHSDVGGGSPRLALSEIALLWMVKCARECGLSFNPDQFVVSPTTPDDEERRTAAKLAPDALADIVDSRRSFYLKLPRFVRELTDTDRQSVASSAVRRLRERSDYRPASLEEWVAAGRRVTEVQDGP